jgi:hypothetical protein
LATALAQHKMPMRGQAFDNGQVWTARLVDGFDRGGREAYGDDDRRFSRAPRTVCDMRVAAPRIMDPVVGHAIIVALRCSWARRYGDR